MIRFFINEGGELKATQCDISPTVYLDHWALRVFSENTRLMARLATALKSRSGTLALSWANLAEFIRITREEQIRQAERLIDVNLPRLFFLEVDPFEVIRRENKLLTGGPPTPPHGDQDFLKVFVTMKPASLDLLSAHDLFQGLRDQGLVQRVEALIDTFVLRIGKLRDEYERDSSFRSAVGRSPKDPRLQRGTRLILRELVRALIVDKHTKITRQQAMDFLHAVVPVAYCDLVLLDKYWGTQVDRIRTRLQKVGMTVPIAMVFSEKANGVERFIIELESAC